jgi:hypothetical protein
MRPLSVGERVAERWRREALLTANRLSHGVESSTAMFLSMSVEIVQCILARSPRFLGCFAPRFALQICKIAGGLIVSPNRFKVDFRETVAVFTVHQLSVPGDPYEIFISLKSMAVSDQSLQTCYPGQEAHSPAGRDGLVNGSGGLVARRAAAAHMLDCFHKTATLMCQQDIPEQERIEG